MKKKILQLAAAIALIFVPFMFFRVLRTAGDDKYYIIQAFEMFQHQSWFIQFYQGVHDYNKGPFHYLAVLLGLKLWGLSMFSTVYMNWICVTATALWISARLKRFLPGFAFATCFGVYFYSFASQMEAEVACFFTLGFLAFLSVTEKKKSSLLFWVIAGLTGWVKSPLYSVLLALSCWLSWGLRGELLDRYKKPSEWFYLLSGVLIGVSGYAWSAFHDWDAFYRTYLMRETFGRGPNMGQWYEAIVGLLFAFVIPWLFHGIETTYHFARNTKSVFKNSKTLEAWAFILPSLLFFALYHYHGQSYSMHLVGILIYWIFDAGKNLKFRISETLVSFLVLIPLGLASLIQFYFHPSSLWWSPWIAPSLLVLGISTLILSLKKKSSIPAMIGFLISTSTVSAFLGEKENYDLKTFPAQNFYYFSINEGIWNEWAYLNFQTTKSITPINFEPEFYQKLKEPMTLLIPGDPALHYIHDLLKAKNIKWDQWVVSQQNWKRWKLRGADDQGNSFFSLALKNHDLSYLERNYYIITTRAVLK